MSNKTLTIASALCITALMQGAASGPEKQKLSIEDCFIKEQTLMVGPDRHYVTFAVSKRVQMAKSFFGDDIFVDANTECSRIMCCVGIVEGSDVKLTDETALLVKEAALLASWPARATNFTKGKAYKKEYLQTALRKAINSSVEVFKKVEDIKLSLVWFQKEERNLHLPGESRFPVEISEGSACHPLREIIMPSVGAKALEIIKPCYSPIAPFSVRLAKLSEYASMSPASHQATVLRTDYNLLDAFFAQELSAGTK